jgi:hypothetical protein
MINTGKNKHKEKEDMQGKRKMHNMLNWKTSLEKTSWKIEEHNRG